MIMTKLKIIMLAQNTTLPTPSSTANSIPNLAHAYTYPIFHRKNNEILKASFSIQTMLCR